MTDPMKYTHYFDFRVSQSFDSDVKDFNKALSQWMDSFKSASEFRKALINSDESLRSLLSDIAFSDTNEHLASAIAGNDE
jgi:hypothetical protein